MMELGKVLREVRIAAETHKKQITIVFLQKNRGSRQITFFVQMLTVNSMQQRGTTTSKYCNLQKNAFKLFGNIRFANCQLHTPVNSF